MQRHGMSASISLFINIKITPQNYNFGNQNFNFTKMKSTFVNIKTGLQTKQH